MIADCYEKLLSRKLISANEAEPKIEQAYEAFVKNHPDNNWFAYSCKRLGDIKVRKQEWLDAAKYKELFLARTPQHDDQWIITLFELGNVYEQAGQNAKAIEKYNMFLELAQPQHPYVSRAKSRVDILNGRRDSTYFEQNRFPRR